MFLEISSCSPRPPPAWPLLLLYCLPNTFLLLLTDRNKWHKGQLSVSLLHRATRVNPDLGGCKRSGNWVVSLGTVSCCITVTGLFTSFCRVSQDFVAAAKRCADALSVLMLLLDTSPPPRVFSWIIRCALCFCVLSTVIRVLWFSDLNPLRNDLYKSLISHQTNLYPSRGVPALCSGALCV